MKKSVRLLAVFFCVATLPAIAQEGREQNPNTSRPLRETNVPAKQAGRPQATQLTPQEVFRRVSSAVFIVESIDADSSVVAFGSGVVVQGPAQITTNRHVIEEAARIRVRRGDKTWPATISRCDAELDLCRLYVPSLNAAPVPLRLSSALQIGERVYAIGAPEGLELTLSEGIISGLRGSGGQGRFIQTTAPLSHGSSGGGLFDAQGRLVGITSFVLKEGQNLNFATPAEWVLSLAERPGAVKGRKTGRNPAESHNEARKAVRQRPDDAGAHLQLGLSLFYDEVDWDGAISELRTAVALDPNDAGAHAALGNALVATSELDGATAEAQALLRLDPKDPAGYGLMGDIFMGRARDGDLAQLGQAIRVYREAVRLAPRDPLYHLSLADALEKSGELDEAIKEHREMIRLKCSQSYRSTESGRYLCASEYDSVGNILRSKGDLEGAVDEYRSALRVDVDLSSPHYGIGKVLFAKGDLDGALAELQLAVNLVPDRSDYREGLCLALERKGLVGEAKAECRAAYLLDPKNTEIRANFERLFQKSKE